ncbi:MAG: sigma-70 family RNA polymerase sigma factor [Bacteroidota bacterium]
MLNEQEGKFISDFIHDCLNSTYSKRVRPSDRGDYAHDIYLKVDSNFNKYDSTKGTLTQWVGRIIKNYIIDQERKKSPINFYDDLSFHGEPNNDYDFDADELFQDRLTHLYKILGQETVENREMFEDFYFTGLSNNEIAKKYHKSESVQAMRRKRFKERVRRTYPSR